MKLEEMLEELKYIEEEEKCDRLERLINAGLEEEAKKFFIACVYKRLQVEKDMLAMEERTIEYYKNRISIMEMLLTEVNNSEEEI